MQEARVEIHRQERRARALPSLIVRAGERAARLPVRSDGSKAGRRGLVPPVGQECGRVLEIGEYHTLDGSLALAATKASSNRVLGMNLLPVRATKCPFPNKRHSAERSRLRHFRAHAACAPHAISKDAKDSADLTDLE